MKTQDLRLSSMTFFVLSLAVLFVSCFSPVEVDDADWDPDACHVTFNVTSIEQIAFDDANTRSTSIADLCSRIGFAIFQDEEKVKSINQTSSDENYGTFKLNLSEGTYQVVLVGHNGKGNATISSPNKITFANNKCTDSFYYYHEIIVDSDGEYSVKLKRAVAMFRLVITDPMPAEVAQMRFTYTGGSSTFDAVAGYGCVNSRQTETFDVPASMIGQTSQFDIYTFPHTQTDELKITVTALSDEGDELYTREFASVPVTVNRISKATTAFFDANAGSSSFSVSIENDGQWDAIIDLDL